jgi:hypothetical protein
VLLPATHWQSSTRQAPGWTQDWSSYSHTTHTHTCAMAARCCCSSASRLAARFLWRFSSSVASSRACCSAWQRRSQQRQAMGWGRHSHPHPDTANPSTLSAHLQCRRHLLQPRHARLKLRSPLLLQGTQLGSHRGKARLLVCVSACVWMCAHGCGMRQCGAAGCMLWWWWGGVGGGGLGARRSRMC